MVKKVNISFQEWLIKEIDARKGKHTRSEFISELCALALGFSNGKEK